MFERRVHVQLLDPSRLRLAGFAGHTILSSLYDQAMKFHMTALDVILLLPAIVGLDYHRIALAVRRFEDVGPKDWRNERLKRG